MRNLLLTAGLILVSSIVGHAQSAKYCSNALVANAFYSTVKSNGKTAEVEYHGRFQNQDANGRSLVAFMLRPPRIGAFLPLRAASRIDLAAYQQKDVVIFAVQTQNPSASGAPTPAELGPAIQFSCTFTK